MDKIILLLGQAAQQLPVELFVFLGSFIEEAISPIPSFLVLIPAGAAAHVQGYPWWYLAVLAVVSATGRILASILLYVLADKAEDVVFGKGRRFFGISHQQLEQYGKRLGGSTRDWFALFSLNAIPALPTAMLSLVCGVLKVRFRLFVSATFFGAIIHSFIHLAIGYAGLEVVSTVRGLRLIERIVVVVVVVGGVVGYLVHRHRAKNSKL
jgi:membrane protein DedA with SNARE-associated domain